MLRTVFALMLGFVVWTTSGASLLAQEPAKKGTDEVKVELLEKGSAPHRQLRFTPKVGDKVSKVMGMKMSQTISMPGIPAQTPEVPGQQMFIDVETKKVASNGDIDYAFTYKDIKIIADKPSPIVSTTEQMMKPMIGSSGTGTMTNRGISKQAEYKAPEGLNPMAKGLIDGMKDSMSKASTPVPDEAVGVGAKWKVVQELNANGIQLTQTTLSEVTEITSTGFTLKTTITQSAPAQDVKNPLLPASATMKLDSLATDGNGKSVFEFNSVFPKSSTVNIKSKTSMKLTINGQNTTMGTDMSMEMTVGDPPKN